MSRIMTEQMDNIEKAARAVANAFESGSANLLVSAIPNNASQKIKICRRLYLAIYRIFNSMAQF